MHKNVAMMVGTRSFESIGETYVRWAVGPTYAHFHCSPTYSWPACTHNNGRQSSVRIHIEWNHTNTRSAFLFFSVAFKFIDDFFSYYFIALVNLCS